MYESYLQGDKGNITDKKNQVYSMPIIFNLIATHSGQLVGSRSVCAYNLVGFLPVRH